MLPMRRATAAPLLCLFLLLAASVSMAAVTPNGRLQVIHLDVGQGDAALLITPLGQVAMIDNGPGGTGVSGLTVAQQLALYGVTHIDHLFTSHYHADHLGGIDEIASAGITIGYAWDRGGSYSTVAYTTYVNTVGSGRRTLVRDQVITLDSLSAHPVRIRCVNLNGAGISTTDENALSVALKVTYGEYDESFCGDIAGVNSGSYKNVESVVGPQMGAIEAYKVHHHGSSTSTYTAWLGWTTPKIAIVPVGTGNSYGHPTAAALTRLHNAGVKCYWTETGSGATPVAGWDYVANGRIEISATWEPAGTDTVRGNGFVHTFTNSGSSADVTPPIVALTSPDGGETWKAGSSHLVTWTATDEVGVTAVDLAYSTDGGATFPHAIATGLGNTGSCWWTVPDLVTATARVRAIARDAAGNAGRDSSAGVFAIDKWIILATAGEGGTITPSGSVPVSEGADQAFTIEAAAGHAIADVVIDGYASLGPVTEYTFMGVSANRTIEATFTTDAYVVEVETIGGGTVDRAPDLETYAWGDTVRLSAQPWPGWGFAGWSGDTSGTENPVTLTVDGDKAVTATFVDVAGPTVTVIAPAGGEAWEAGLEVDVRWSAHDNVSVTTVDVDFSLWGPEGPWLPVAHGVANTGTVPWTLPAQTADSARVRVTAYDPTGNPGIGMSDSTFQIVEPGGVGVGRGPAVLALARPRPNPSRGTVALWFSLPEGGWARLEVMDLSGRRVHASEGWWPAGPSLVRWDGAGSTGAGLYFVRLTTPWGTRTERLARLD